MLTWKLLRKNLSVPQLAGYVSAGLVGLVIILSGIQFYADTRPLYSSNESFLNPDFLVINKKVSLLSNLSQTAAAFSEKEIDDLEKQPFVKKTGFFTSGRFGIHASLSLSAGGQFHTEMFFEAVPDDFIDVQSERWGWRDGQNDIPIIIPRTYLTLYNFGFAQTQGLPRVSESLAERIKFSVTIYNARRSRSFDARIAGFSDKLNTILAPESFLKWANLHFGDGEAALPSRILVETHNPGDPQIASYFGRKNYEIVDYRGNTSKAAYFLRVVTFTVLTVGVIITLLAISLMLLSISMLIYKNRSTLENLLLLGYSRTAVARPYQLLGLSLTGVIFALAFGLTLTLRSFYTGKISLLFDHPFGDSGALFTFFAGFLLLLLIGFINAWWVRKKVNETANH
ncbi:MAG: ABC transporter permease [Prevotellaceae bacterium]|jgi:hypothetical protein|nr:ABC transporter permease [Prevotellaceae bacterium]